MPDTVQLIPLAEAAHRLGMSWERAWRLVLSGQLAGEKRGRLWYVERGSVTRHLEEQEDGIG